MRRHTEESTTAFRVAVIFLIAHTQYSRHLVASCSRKVVIQVLACNRQDGLILEGQRPVSTNIYYLLIVSFKQSAICTCGSFTSLLFAMNELLMLRVTCIQASLQLRQMFGWFLFGHCVCFWWNRDQSRGYAFFYFLAYLSCALTKSSEHDQVETCLNLSKAQ